VKVAFSLWGDIFIEKDEHLMKCGRYIERNPLRAGIVADLSDCHFSNSLAIISTPMVGKMI
jgi:hypothetical protein